MANYENGAHTRQAIITACKKLFYEKGYYATSHADICKAARVNRGTIYYHFETKEAMRYEVQWEYITHYRHIAQQFCPDARYHYIIAMYFIWKQICADSNLRRFYLEICMDFPVYTGKRDMTYFYFTAYDKMWGAFLEKKDIPALSFASVYGYIMSCMRMLCEHPDRYDPMELFEHCVNSSASIWGIPEETMAGIWQEVKHCLSLIPEEEIQMRLS